MAYGIQLQPQQSRYITPEDVLSTLNNQPTPQKPQDPFSASIAIDPTTGSVNKIDFSGTHDQLNTLLGQQSVPEVPQIGQQPVQQPGINLGAVNPEQAYQQTQTQPLQVNDIHDILNTSDPNKLLQHYKLNDPAAKAAVEYRSEELADIDENLTKATQQVQNLSKATPQERLDFQKQLEEAADQGSWLKAGIFGALGLSNLAEKEVGKIVGNRETRVMSDFEGNTAAITYKNGVPVAGFAPGGKKIEGEDLLKFNLTAEEAAKKATAGRQFNLYAGDRQAGGFSSYIKDGQEYVRIPGQQPMPVNDAYKYFEKQGYTVNTATGDISAASIKGKNQLQNAFDRMDKQSANQLDTFLKKIELGEPLKLEAEREKNKLKRQFGLDTYTDKQLVQLRLGGAIAKEKKRGELEAEAEGIFGPEVPSEQRISKFTLPPKPANEQGKVNLKTNSDFETTISDAKKNASSTRSDLEITQSIAQRHPDWFGKLSKSPTFKQLSVILDGPQTPNTREKIEELAATAGVNPADRAEFDQLVIGIKKMQLQAKTGLSAKLADSNVEAKNLNATIAGLQDNPKTFLANVEMLKAQHDYNDLLSEEWSKATADAGGYARFSKNQFLSWFDSKQGPGGQFWANKKKDIEQIIKGGPVAPGKQYQVGDIITRGGKRYRVVGGDPADPDVAEVK